ncbi:serine hydrolase domain-containing protein [Plantactinospora solaniradicis]|uniref:Serine hydrolase domain-containing protein n=1 Tax=Plantactinospora solaniradicis TaxID=1723736 RepID=A0ABW1KIX2_9ACTN
MLIFFRTLRITALCLVLAAVNAVAPAPALAQPDRADSPGGLDRAALQRALDAIPEAGAPGTYAAVRAGRSEWGGAAGIADLSNARPTRPDLRHRVGSITKTFVSTTLLQLVDEGRLRLDDPVGRWLPQHVPGEVGQQVTVRMLLNHTSGIGNYTDALLNSLEAIEQVRTATYAPAQLVEIGLGLPRTGAPGESFAYSNTNYILAGLIIEKVTGNDPTAEVTRRIIRPLKLTDTYFPGADPRIRGRHAGAYFAPLGVRNFAEYNMTWAWTAGELVATMDDLNTFYRALLGGRLLSAATLNEMLTVVPFDPEAPETGGYGLGIYQMATPCGSLWGHDGGVVGQITFSLHSRDASRQASFGLNISHYQLFTPEAHPIDVAWVEFLLTAHCPQDAVAATGAATPLPTPGIDSVAVRTR